MAKEFDLEDEDTLNEQDIGSDENLNDDNEDGNEEEETPKKKNPSNFKKLSKALKWALAELEEKEKLIAKLSADKKEPQADNTEFRLFLVENPEAVEYKAELKEMMSNPKYTALDLDEMLDFVKVKFPKSQDKEDFDLKSKQTIAKKKLTELTNEEAIQLDNKSYLEYMRQTGKLKI